MSANTDAARQTRANTTMRTTATRGRGKGAARRQPWPLRHPTLSRIDPLPAPAHTRTYRLPTRLHYLVQSTHSHINNEPHYTVTYSYTRENKPQSRARHTNKKRLIFCLHRLHNFYTCLLHLIHYASRNLNCFCFSFFFLFHFHTKFYFISMFKRNKTFHC